MQVTQAGLAMDLSRRLDPIQVVDLEPLIRATRPRGQHWYFDVDGHWNANGHRGLSTLLKERLPARH